MLNATSYSNWIRSPVFQEISSNWLMYIHFNYRQKPCISLKISKDQFGAARVTCYVVFIPSFGFPFLLYCLSKL